MTATPTTGATAAHIGHRPPIRTFKPRRRALSASRTALLEGAGQRWLLSDQGPPIDVEAVFGRRAPLVIEVGFGAGEALIAMAAADPTTDVIGIEVHTPGVAAAVAALDEAVAAAGGAANVRIVHGDALEFLARLVPGSVAGWRVFFPDPWPKVRHRHRRLIGERHLDRLVDRLAPGGFVHIATDVDDYAATAQAACDAHSALVGGVIERPSWRPETRFERKGIDAGHLVTDLWYVRQSSVI